MTFSGLDNPSTELELSLKTVEARLENNESIQKTTAQRLEQLYSALAERLNSKDDAVDRLKGQSEWVLKQNDTLLKQIGLRWNLLTGLTTLVGLAFTITLGYQIWRVEQVMDTKRALEQGTKLLAQNTKAYSEILSTLAHADTLMAESNREFQRAEYKISATLASTAIGFLKSALDKTGVDIAELQKQTSYDGATCSMIANPIANSARASSNSDYAALNPEALRPAVTEALFTAYDLHSRGSFFSAPRSDPRDDGITLLALDGSRWEGYHWIGLAAELEGAGSFTEATACFRRSVDRNRVGNKDYVNLAELSFIHSDYSGAKKFAEQYLHPLNYRFRSPVDVVAQFYFSTAGFLSEDSNARNRMPPEKFRKSLNKLLPDFTLEGTFTPGDLTNFLSSQEFAAHVLPDQRHEVQLSVNCLIEKKCTD